MKIITICICFLLAIVGYAKDKKIYGVTGFFGLFFGCILLFEYIKPFELYDASDLSYKFVLIGVSSYFIGCIVNSFFPLKINLESSKRIDEDYILVSRFKYAFILSFLCFTPYLFNTFKYLLSGHSFGQVYYAFAANRYYGDSTFDVPYIFQIFYEFVGKTIAFLLVPLSLVIFAKTGNKKYMITSIICTLMFVLVGFQRTYIINIILYVILVLLIFKKIKTPRKKLFSENIPWIYNNKKKIIALGLIFICSFFLVSQSRSSVNNGKFNFFRTLYYYYCICLKLFDNAMIEFSNADISYTYGFFSLRGMLTPFVSMLQLLGIPIELMDHADYLLNRISMPIYVSASEKTNSFVTIFFSFFADGGVIGIIMGSFFTGYIAHNLYTRAQKAQSTYSITMFIMFFVSILCFSMVNCGFIQISVFWSFFILRFFFLKKKVNNDIS